MTFRIKKVRYSQCPSVCRPRVRLSDAEAPVHMRRQQHAPRACWENPEHLVTSAGEGAEDPVRGTEPRSRALWVSGVGSSGTGQAGAHCGRSVIYPVKKSRVNIVLEECGCAVEAL